MIRYKTIGKTVSILLVVIALTIQSKSKEWYSNEVMLTLNEAITKISSESIYVDPQHTIPKTFLKSYIHKIDPYGDYFTKDEYKAFQNTLSPEYAGVGMILYQQKRNEKILCIPIAKELKKKGISKYDELISVDGRLVKGKNFYLVSSWIRGRKNSSITFKIQKPSGQVKNITLSRKEQHFQSTLRVVKNEVAMIKIIRFMRGTPQELQSILHKWPKSIPIVIDLRGNGGGSLFAAIQSADLFLSKDTLISSIETTKRHIDYRALTSDFTEGSPVFVLQDEFTASAAEVFIAALTQNYRVQSIGKKSFGKGVAQKFIPLSNGDTLLLTYAKIITPNGKSYHKKGLLPTSDLSLEALLQTVKLSLF